MFEKHRKTAFAVFTVLSILCMVCIFLFSAAPAENSAQMSSGVTEKVVRFYDREYDSLTKETQENTFAKLEAKVRKSAHFCLFAVLGVFVALACFFCTEKDVLKYVVGFLVCFLYGATDELHQYFSPGRSPLVKDVFIDGAGSAVGMILVLLVIWAVKSKLAKRVAK